MKYFRLKDVPTTEYCYHPDIFAVQERTEDRTTWYVINYSTMYKKSEWTLHDAITHYLSKDGEMERDYAFRKAYGFYD